MDWFSKLIDLFRKAEKFSLTKRILIILAVCLGLAAALFGGSSCSSTRSMSVTVDKAEKVDIHLKDSINAQVPMF